MNTSKDGGAGEGKGVNYFSAFSSSSYSSRENVKEGPLLINLIGKEIGIFIFHI